MKRPRDPNQRAKHIVELATGQRTEPPAKNTSAAEAGRKGAKARAAKLSAARRSAIAKKAAQARWSRGLKV